MFDETFIHSAENATDVNRTILFCDVGRPMKYGFMSAINRWVSHHIVKASATQNVDGENVGVLNKLFGKLYEIHLASRKVKEWNRNVYYTLKYSLKAVVLGLIMMSALRCVWRVPCQVDQSAAAAHRHCGLGFERRNGPKPSHRKPSASISDGACVLRNYPGAGNLAAPRIAAFGSDRAGRQSTDDI